MYEMSGPNVRGKSVHVWPQCTDRKIFNHNLYKNY